MFTLRALMTPLRSLPMRPAVPASAAVGQSWRAMSSTLTPIQGSEVRVGMTVEIKGKAYKVTKANHVKPGKGGAFNQVSMTEAFKGTKMDMRLRVDETVQKLFLGRPTRAQFMYIDGDVVHLMDNTTFEQFEVHKDTLGEDLPFIQDGVEMKLLFYKDVVVDVELPTHATCKIKELDYLKHTSMATLENGVVIKVPTYITLDDSVKLSIKDRTFVGKA